jgi:hypothetical protein
VHTATAQGRSFLDRELLTSVNFAVGTVLMFAGGLIMTGTLALLSTMLENLMNYPAMTTGFTTRSGVIATAAGLSGGVGPPPLFLPAAKSSSARTMTGAVVRPAHHQPIP